MNKDIHKNVDVNVTLALESALRLGLLWTAVIYLRAYTRYKENIE